MVILLTAVSLQSVRQLPVYRNVFIKLQRYRKYVPTPKTSQKAPTRTVARKRVLSEDKYWKKPR